jgi:hypothetical protein
MTAPSISAHGEHVRAERKHESWLKEIEVWKTEHRRALETLEMATMFVQEHDALLDHHMEKIAEHARALSEHEAAIASSGPDQEPSTMAAEHERLEDLHQGVLEQHNRFRGRHPALMKEIARLAVELHKVSHQPG